MANTAADTIATIIPTMRYHDAPAAIEWLCSTFGFEKQLVVPGDDGRIAHAQLTLGNGMVMLGSAADDGYGALVKPPEDRDSACTQSPYVVVNDIDAVHDRAVKTGAKIEMELTEEDYGGKDFSCRDPEGHLWNFGSYDPWKNE